METEVPASEAPAVPQPEGLPPVLPEGNWYKLKNRVLGPPLHTEELEHQRIGVPTAIAVFSSDCISSSAYATEEILRILLPIIGVFAFSLVVPVTLAMIVVLVFLILSYRQTVKEYPTAGGSYMVSRDNFGPVPGLVAGTSLLIDYTLTVAVSGAAGVAAVTSVISPLTPYRLPMTIAVVWFIALVNLRGVKESGRIFMVPTYFFIAAMGVMFLVGIAKLTGGVHIGHIPIHSGADWNIRKFPHGKSGAENTLLYGAGLFAVLKAYASGGSAMTGVEAISNGVTAFRQPQWVNARKALVWMGLTLGICFFGLSFFATYVHPVTYTSGSPTVISQVGKQLFGSGGLGSFAYLFLQASTMLILVLAANTSFADFPRLASFAAEDAFLPRQLTKRGHRLVFSNGIIALAVAATVLLLATNATVSALIPLYALGVFTSFTLSQAGMTRHHLRTREPGWQKGLVINAIGAVLSGIVDIIILVTKFTEGAWVVVIAIPLLILLFIRLNKQYDEELHELANEAEEMAGAPILKRHVVLVMVDKLSRAVARALQYARTLTPDEIRAIHFAIDEQRARDLAIEWRKLGLTRIPLQLIECPDRRIDRAALEAAAEEAIDGETEVTVLLPRLEYRRLWHRVLHDRTADHIAEALGDLPHVNVTFVPYHLAAGSRAEGLSAADVLEQAAATRHAEVGHLRTVTIGGPSTDGGRAANGAENGGTARRDEDAALDTRLAELSGKPPSGVANTISGSRFRQRVELTGRVKSVRVQPWSGVAALEVTLADDTGQIQLVFLGRRDVPGIEVGRRMSVRGIVGQHKGRLAVLNPAYELFAS